MRFSRFSPTFLRYAIAAAIAILLPFLGMKVGGASEYLFVLAAIALFYFRLGSSLAQWTTFGAVAAIMVLRYFYRDVEPVVAADYVDGSLFLIVGFSIHWMGNQTEDRTRKLEESELHFRSLANGIPQIVWSNSGSVPDFYNDKIYEYSGMPKPAGNGPLPKFGDIIHPEDMPRLMKNWREALDNVQIFEMEYRLRNAEGNYRWFLGRSFPIRDSQGKVIRWFGTATDVHDQKLAVEERQNLISALEMERKRLSLVIEQMPAGVIVATAPTGKIILRNDQVVEILGEDLSINSVENYAQYGAIHEDGAPFNFEQYPLARSLLHGEVVQNELIRYRRPSGVERMLEVSSGPITGEKSQIIGAVVTFSDVTQRVQAEKERESLAREQIARAEAERANRTKDEFLAVLSHELRTPLQAVLSWTQLLNTGRLSAEQTSKGLQVIQRSVRTQMQIIKDLLDVSRIISGKLQIVYENVNLEKVIRSVVELVSPNAADEGVTLEIVTRPIGGVLGDPDRIQQMIWNLLTNAIKFTPRGGKVTISTTERFGQAVIQVRDTGTGISADFLPHIFERFRQADATRTRAHGGLGLGLAIVRHLVELHHGTVVAESDGVGQGSLFTITMPLQEVEVAPSEELAAEVSSNPHPLLGMRILVLEDEPATREVISEILTGSGAEVRAAASAQEGIRAFGEFHPQVIASDIGMPGEDGFEFIRKIRRLGPEHGGATPALALTAYASTEDCEEALKAGFQLHLAKPVTPSELTRAIEKLAKNKSAS